MRGKEGGSQAARAPPGKDCTRNGTILPVIHKVLCCHLVSDTWEELSLKKGHQENEATARLGEILSAPGLMLTNNGPGTPRTEAVLGFFICFCVPGIDLSVTNRLSHFLSRTITHQEGMSSMKLSDFPSMASTHYSHSFSSGRSEPGGRTTPLPVPGASG